jgi:hypothetical protein
MANTMPWPTLGVAPVRSRPIDIGQEAAAKNSQEQQLQEQWAGKSDSNM